MEPLISVIIPIYNVEDYLGKCIASVLNQTYKNIEIFLINDGSTDSGMRICEFYASCDERIKLLSQQHSGVSCARNLGVYHARGDYIVFVDADDWILPDYIQILYSSMIGYSADMAIVDYYIEKNELLTYCGKKGGSATVFTSGETLNRIFDTDKFSGYLWNKIFRSEIIRAYHMKFHTKALVWEDLLFCCEYISKIKTAIYMRTPLYVYRSRKNSIVNSRSCDIEQSKFYITESLLRLAFDTSGKFNSQTHKIFAASCIDYLTLDFKKGEYNTKSISEKLLLVKPYFCFLSAKNKIKYYCLRNMPKQLFHLYTWYSTHQTKMQLKLRRNEIS